MPTRSSRTPSRAAQLPDGRTGDVGSWPWPLVATLIVLAALGARLLHLSQIADAPFFGIVMGDSKSYDAWAQQIAGGDWIGHDVFYQAPLYPYFLGVVYSVARHSLVAVRVVQMLLGSIAVALIADATRRLFGRPAALIAGLSAALYPPGIFFDGLIQKTSLDAFLTCIVLWMVSRILVSGATWGRWFGLGATIGALSLTRENALVLAPLLLAWCVWPAAGANDEAVARRVRHAGVFVAGLALLLLPVAARNAAVGGGFYLTTSQFGPNLYLGNNPRTDGTAGSLIAGRGTPEYERQDATDIAERAAKRSLTPAEISSYWTGQTLAFIRSEPGHWLRLMARKTALLWNAAEAFDTESQESYAEYSIVIRLLQPIAHFGVLVPLAALGFWTTWPDRRRLWIFYAIVATYGASVVLFFIYARYRYPLVPFLLMFAAAGLVGLPAYLRGASARRRLAFAASGLVIVVFTNWPLLAGSDARAVTEHNVGAALQSNGQLDAAIAQYRKALSINPRYVPAYSNMGAALLAKGDLGGAIEAYRQALAIDPGFGDAHFNLGNALLKQGQAGAAISQFEQALASAPESVDARTNLAIALLDTKQPDRAIAELTRVIALAPKALEPRRVLADALSEVGRPEEALAQLQQIVALAPDDGEAHHAIGRLSLEAGRAADAIAPLQQSARLSPSSGTHNDLGIALATAGRRDEAISEFREALRLDPGNAEARRNLEIATR